MSTSSIISVVSIIIYIGILISIPFRIKKYGKREKSDDERSFWIREISVFIFSFVICALCFRLDFGIVGDVVLCGCGLFGEFIAVKELTAQKNEE